MTEFRESDIIFQFNENWVVNKYDEHRYFQRLAGAGLKGVDFLGIYNKEELVLIEVKNYRIRYKEKAPTEIYHILENPEVLVEKIKQKSEDTLRAIRVINKLYQRNWFYKLWMPILKLLRNTPFTVNTWLFWTRAQVLIETGKFKVILWLENEEEYEIFSKEDVLSFRDRVQVLLNDNESNIDFKIIDIRKPKSSFNDSISASLVNSLSKK
jgi:hypothetical protein